MSFRILGDDHLSDLFIEGVGNTKVDAIENLAKGLFYSLTRKTLIEYDEVIEIDVNGIDEEDLIINLFNEILANIDIAGKVGVKLKIVNYSSESFSIKAKLYLVKAKAVLAVKAVTFHEYSFKSIGGSKKDGEGPFVLRLLFDV